MKEVLKFVALCCLALSPLFVVFGCKGKQRHPDRPPGYIVYGKK